MSEQVITGIWRRKRMKRAVYCVESHTEHTVHYSIFNQEGKCYQMSVSEWHDTMEECDIDDMMMEAGGIF